LLVKDIKGFEGYYAVTEDGRVWSYLSAKYLKTPLTGAGYPQVYFGGGGFLVSRVVHRLIAETFIPNPLNYPQINHKNGIKTDNRVENLEWCTNQYNRDHAVANKLHAYGERSGQAKLTTNEVMEIRARLNTVISQLSEEFDISEKNIRSIAKLTIWKQAA
jgi:HNH endonuclease/NUMOD4 motif